MADTDKLVEQLSGLSVLEIAGLVKQLEEKWGVSAAAPVAIAAGPPAGGAGGAAPGAGGKKAVGVGVTKRGAQKKTAVKKGRRAVPGVCPPTAENHGESAPKKN